MSIPFASLEVGDSFTFVPGGPLLIKSGALTYRTAGGLHLTRCNPTRQVHSIVHGSTRVPGRYNAGMRATLSDSKSIERTRTIMAMRAASQAITDGDPARAKRILVTELEELSRVRTDP